MSVNDVMVIAGINPKTCTTKNRQKDDFYTTTPEITEELMKLETFDKNIWECAVGRGDLADVLIEHGYDVYGTDIVDRGYSHVVLQDFLECTTPFDGDIITNPPYKLGTEFVLKALELTKRKVAMVFKLQFVEGVNRYKNLWSKYPPKVIYVFSRRVGCLKNGIPSHSRSAICYCWIVWDKEYTGETKFKWIDNV